MAALEVIVPAVAPPHLLIESLALQDRKPDLVTVVSNEFHARDLDPRGFDVRVMHFSSDYYCIGDADVVLRRNIGIWAAVADDLVFQDDDQIAGQDMIRSAGALLRDSRSFWGHHRFLDFEGQSVASIVGLEPSDGEKREHPPNYYHGWQSCYGGMFGARREFLLELGGFDMAFMGRHGSEDQDLGRRMLLHEGKERVFIWEPPFAWHPLRSPLRQPQVVTSCGDHQLEEPKHGVRHCGRCPYYRAEEVLASGAEVRSPFEPELVRWWAA